jgi:hypothetical protein
LAAVIAQKQHAIEQVRIIGGEHATFAGGDGLAVVEAERRRASEGAGFASSIGRAQGFGRVLDQLQAISVGDPLQSLSVAHRAVEIDPDDGLGFRPDRSLDGIGIDAPGIRQDIDENRLRADVDDRRDGSDPVTFRTITS